MSAPEIRTIGILASFPKISHQIHPNYTAENAAKALVIKDEFSIKRYLLSTALRVVDIGCTEGRGGKELKSIRPDIELIGLDCVEERLVEIPDCYSRKILGLTNQIPLKDRSCDAIVAGEFLEHLYPADVDPTLYEFQRILEIGGTLMMTTPNPYSLKMRRHKGSV